MTFPFSSDPTQPPSRAELRSDLLAMQRDLLDRLDERLEKKADASDVEPLIQSIASLNEWRIRAERGEFTEAQKGVVTVWISKSFSTRAKESWAGWERKFAVVAVGAGLLGAVGGIAAAVEVFVR